MKVKLPWQAICLLTIVLSPIPMSAHFKLLSPDSWITSTELGDPQKVGPCGGDTRGNNEKLLTNAVTKVTGGSLLKLRIQETIFHSGHYRVALAASRTDLPPDPAAIERWTERGPYSVWAPVQSPPQIPVLADGLFPHYAKPGEPSSAVMKTPMAPWEADILIPNINCPKCTLQVIQFMADHAYNQPGGYAYHHCADLNIVADPSKPLSKGWPTAAQSN